MYNLSSSEFDYYTYEGSAYTRKFPYEKQSQSGFGASFPFSSFPLCLFSLTSNACYFLYRFPMLTGIVLSIE
jgi:hypothetical protein